MKIIEIHINKNNKEEIIDSFRKHYKEYDNIGNVALYIDEEINNELLSKIFDATKLYLGGFYNNENIGKNTRRIFLSLEDVEDIDKEILDMCKQYEIEISLIPDFSIIKKETLTYLIQKILNNGNKLLIFTPMCDYTVELNDILNENEQLEDIIKNEQLEILTFIVPEYKEKYKEHELVKKYLVKDKELVFFNENMKHLQTIKVADLD
ncbi:hypothetical protein [Fusobacterium polymorphum]|uniref:Uncharacterized protein n=1 Tax=Fusobacterium nucleatum subsp. polymorphum TaxID=76857 RepID=A0A2C6AX27_FUSNP|nr:hypothetical protein [Fusobacterium polymorphum]PHI06679.1 hypothetical protein CBG54_06325 [Fusobacterium polymorphum]